MKALVKNKFLWTILSIAAFVFIIFALLPKPIDANLEKIGNGQNAVVFVYDPNLVVSNQQANEMNDARTMMGDQALFLIARIGDPPGDNFKQRYQARRTALLFFNGKGELIDRQMALLSASELVEKLSIK